MEPSFAKRKEILDALRRGLVPRRGIEHLATGLDRFGPAIDGELDQHTKVERSRPFGATTDAERPSSLVGASNARW